MKATEIRALLAAAQARLQGHPDVTAVGIGEKFTDGKPASTYAIIVSVEDKGRPVGDPIPKHLLLKGWKVATDIRTASRKDFIAGNGALDGSDLLIASTVGRVGTLGFVATEAGGGRFFGMTNAHVVSRPNEDHTGDAIMANASGTPEVIGHVAYQSSYRTGVANTVDLAMIELNAVGRALARTFAIQTFNGLVTGSDGLSFSRFGGALRAHKYGGSTSLSRDVVGLSQPAEHSAVDLTDQSGVHLRFGRSFVLSATSPGVQAGHSGALLVREMTNGNMVATGLLAGGRGTTALAFSTTEINAELRTAGIQLS